MLFNQALPVYAYLCLEKRLTFFRLTSGERATSDNEKFSLHVGDVIITKDYETQLPKGQSNLQAD